MQLPTTQSFTPLATIRISKPCILHPNACSPAMDLVALLLAPDSILSIKGKGKASAGGGRIALWRMTGGKVWEVDTDGEVQGLAWSTDGLHLSLLIHSPDTVSASSYALKHLSVHDGSVVRSVPLPQMDIPESSTRDLKMGNRWWRMEWESSELAWEKPRPGSSRMIIDSLPRPTPVEPPQPANMLPAMLKAAAIAKSKAKFHPKLSTFPTLLSSQPDTAPDILYVSPPSSGTTQRYLTGTFPIQNKSPSPSILDFAQLAQRLTGILEIVLRGLESAQHAFLEGQKQGMIWREELETCGEQQGLTKDDVHADLFRLLLTGRGGVAVSEWLGNRLTGRTIMKWEAALETSFKTIRKVITESITPALERIVLILEELIGWSRSSAYKDELVLPESSYQRSLRNACDTLKLVESMRQLANHELQASMEFMKWLKYETGRSARDVSQDGAQNANHDLKYTWAYLKGEFVESPFIKHFPALDKPAEEVICPTANESRKVAPLRDVLQDTLHRLNQRGDQAQVADEQVDQSEYSSMALTDAELSMSEVIESPESSDSEDTVERRDPPKPSERVLRLEPWVWVNTLIKECESLIRSAVGGEELQEMGISLDPGGSSLYAERKSGDDTWVAFVVTSRIPQELWLLRIPSSDTSSAFLSVLALTDDSGGNASCLALQFFDDEELVFLLESASEGSENHLVTIRYSELAMNPVPVPQRNLGEVANEVDQAFLESLQPIPVHRSRMLSVPVTKGEEMGRMAIALNGRKGRRVGCVSMKGGKEVEVFDMDEDEDEDESDEEDEGGDMSGIEDY